MKSNFLQRIGNGKLHNGRAETLQNNTKDRFGFDAPKNKPLEESIQWAAENGFGYIDFQADVPPNDIGSFDAARVRRVRDLCETHEIAIGIHPSSAINNAEYTPIMSEAVDDYLFANLELAQRLGCGWLIGHGGYHFGDIAQRRDAAINRIQRLVERAEQAEIVIFFENHNREPEHAEIHYIPHNVEETHWFFDALRSPYLKWAFNVAHGHLVPEGWQGFLDAFGVENIGQVRLNDNTGEYEIHLIPGEGTIDFGDLFAQLNGRGYEGWFSLGFGDDADKVRVRDEFAEYLES
ncbi:sugar phosphate isomerase/epimerase [Candidatus Poribacteria bacterium]|nr:MAG: sugar phosphate isomerase/epimerase [Candidatus Poribacteria bacterium]